MQFCCFNLYSLCDNFDGHSGVLCENDLFVIFVLISRETVQSQAGTDSLNSCWHNCDFQLSLYVKKEIGG